MPRTMYVCMIFKVGLQAQYKSYHHTLSDPQALRVINSFARGPAKGDCRGFDGDYTEVNIQKRTNS